MDSSEVIPVLERENGVWSEAGERKSWEGKQWKCQESQIVNLTFPSASSSFFRQFHSSILLRFFMSTIAISSVYIGILLPSLFHSWALLLMKHLAQHISLYTKLEVLLWNMGNITFPQSPRRDGRTVYSAVVTFHYFSANTIEPPPDFWEVGNFRNLKFFTWI